MPLGLFARGRRLGVGNDMAQDWCGDRLEAPPKPPLAIDTSVATPPAVWTKEAGPLCRRGTCWVAIASECPQGLSNEHATRVNG